MKNKVIPQAVARVELIVYTKYVINPLITFSRTDDEMSNALIKQDLPLLIDLNLE
jgi:hypothetical protein